LARARNGAPDRNRVAVRNASLDLEGFDALPADRRKIWDDVVEAYRVHAAALDIGYGPLVDVNYAVADLPAGAHRKREGDPHRTARGVEQSCSDLS
jgi:hypothetical protein